MWKSVRLRAARDRSGKLKREKKERLDGGEDSSNGAELAVLSLEKGPI
jgi:hypothetical protein